MNSKTITVKGKKVQIRFGMWALQTLDDLGYKLADIGEELSGNYLKFLPVLLRVGVCAANGRDLNAYSEDFIIDYLDGAGVFSDEVRGAIQCFTSSLSQGVKEKKSQTPAAKAK